MKIFPSDIDSVVERFDRVTDVCAFRWMIPSTDRTWGLQLFSQIQAMRSSAPFIIDERALADPKMPVRWWLIEEIPRTSRGKINRDAVKAHAWICPYGPLGHPSKGGRSMNVRGKNGAKPHRISSGNPESGVPVESLGDEDGLVASGLIDSSRSWRSYSTWRKRTAWTSRIEAWIPTARIHRGDLGFDRGGQPLNLRDHSTH